MDTELTLLRAGQRELEQLRSQNHALNEANSTSLFQGLFMRVYVPLMNIYVYILILSSFTHATSPSAPIAAHLAISINIGKQRRDSKQCG